MRVPLILVSTLVILASLSFSNADGKKASPSTAEPRFTESPQPPSNPPEIGGSMFQAAAANTVTLGWWQFDVPSGGADPQGWTTHDLTEQAATYFHIDGLSGGGADCNNITPINGQKSMWCGQWPTADEPWCNWAHLPGYGNDWRQVLLSDTITCNTLTWSWTAVWDSEPSYDFTTVTYQNGIGGPWFALDPSGGSYLGYDGTGGPVTESFQITPYGGKTILKYFFQSDGGASDEDGGRISNEGGIKLDDITVACQGGPTYFHDFETEPCRATQTADGFWKASAPSYGNRARLVSGTSVVQEDPCAKVLGYFWGYFDDPEVTNYACGGWPLQGAVGDPDFANDIYLHNEVWSPWVPITGAGSQYLLQFLTYRDLDLEDNIFYFWQVRTRDAGGTVTPWADFGFLYSGTQKDWFRQTVDVSSLISSGASEMQIALGAIDMCRLWWCEIQCRSHSPLFDQVKIIHVETYGPIWTVRDIDLWQDNFPELGGISSTSYARCDMAQDILPSYKKNIVPGDSLKIVVTDPAGLAADNTGGRTDTKAVYVFVRVTDRYGNPIAGKNGLAIQSPDKKRSASDATGLLRYPFVAGLAPAGWDAYRLDLAKTTTGGTVKDTYCGDLMDLAAGPDGPPYHALTENVAANTGIFAPGDVIHYFFGAKNTLNQWSYWHRTYDGQGSARRTNSIAEAVASPCEWSVLPDAGRLAGDAGDMLFVDDADDRGGPAQLYFDMALRQLGYEDGFDRYDVLGPSSVVGNSLAGRVKNIAAQIIGDPVEIYQGVFWNSADLSRGLMGDGGTPNGGSSAEKSDDFGLCYTFLNTHPDNPGWAMWCDDAVQDWNTLVGLSAVNVKSIYMNHTLTNGNQSALTGVVSPRVFPASPVPPAGYLQPTESFYLHGGCPTVHDFDVPGQSGLSRVAHRYVNNTSGQTAALSQVTPNGAASQARFFLGGFGFNFIRDDDLNGVPDYAKHLQEIIAWFQTIVDDPSGLETVAYANRLENAYPNPFNPTTTIKYSIASAGHVSLKIFNAAGQLVRTLVDEDQAPTAEGFSVTWDGASNTGENVASGVYFYKLSAKEFNQTKKMVLLK